MKYTILIAILFFGCRDIMPENEFSFDRVDYTGNELKIDGYYYYNYNSSGDELIRIRFLYRNGVSLSGGNFNISYLPTREEEFVNGSYYNQIKNQKPHTWGVFKIKENTIRIESWGHSTGQYPVFVKEGFILNDTTFNITRIWDLYGDRPNSSYQVNEIYHYKQFSPKPDSTNVFVN